MSDISDKIQEGLDSLDKPCDELIVSPEGVVYCDSTHYCPYQDRVHVLVAQEDVMGTTILLSYPVCLAYEAQNE